MIAIAWAALFSWPFISYMFYRKMSLPAAFCATILGGWLLLPSDAVRLDLPVLPALEKHSIPIFSALILTLFFLRKNDDSQFPMLKTWIPRDPVTVLLLTIMFLGVMGSVSTNGDTLMFGDRVIRGVGLYDGMSYALSMLVMIVPLLLARRLLASPQAQRVLLMSIVVGAIAYALPIMWEVRMSPQLHTNIYGFFPHQFAQAIRDGGFRPVVFLGHGLVVALFLCYAVIAAAGILRLSPPEQRIKWIFITAGMFVLLLLTKSLGALIIAVVLVPMVLFLPLRLQLMGAAAIAAMVMTYPVLRAAHVIPVDTILEAAADVSAARAQSLGVRIDAEEKLLARAQERPLFGWGGWGRNRVFDHHGRDLAVTDGSWVIEMGNGGWFRYISMFGLMCWPIFGLFLSRRASIDPVSVVLALVLTAKLIDLIPNSGFPALNWMMAGALIGRLEMSRLLRNGVDDVERIPVRARAQPAGAGGADGGDGGGSIRPGPVYARRRPKTGRAGGAEPATAAGTGRLPYARPRPASGHRK